MDGWMEGNRTGWNCDLEHPGEGEDESGSQSQS
jgi:hypothetical protein